MPIDLFYYDNVFEWIYSFCITNYLTISDWTTNHMLDDDKNWHDVISSAETKPFSTNLFDKYLVDYHKQGDSTQRLECHLKSPMCWISGIRTWQDTTVLTIWNKY
jgi:hypothetical protein